MQKTRHVYQTIFILAAIILTARNLLGYTKATIESWCPGGGIESLVFYVKNNAFLCAVSGLNLILFIAITIGTLIAGRAFCSWVCPIGTIHELLARAGKALGIRRDTAWQGAGRYVGLVRYPVLLLILWATMSYADLILRPFCPYYVVMSGQEHEIAWWSKWLMVALGGMALALPFFWCRLLCPLGTTLGLFRLASPVAPTIDPGRCTSCGDCSRSCPQQILVHEVRRVWSTECTSCAVCIDACPHRAIGMKIGYTAPSRASEGSETSDRKRFGLSRKFLPAIVALMMLAGILTAWNIPMPTVSKTFGNYGKTANTASVEMIVTGLRCRGTALTFSWIIEQDSGILSFDAFVAEHRARILYDPSAIDPKRIKALIEDGRTRKDKKTGIETLVRPFIVERILEQEE